MSYYNNSYNPCFDGNCLVLTGDKSEKCVKDIKKGDIIISSNGRQAKVICVVKTHCKNGKANLVELDGGLLITPWHPVRINSVWSFPSDLEKVSERYCPAVYSFVLESEHIMIINGIECVTLGHNFKEPVVQHSYFGTEQVILDLQNMDDGWDDGLVELYPGCLVRDIKTGLVCGIKKGSNEGMFVSL